MIFVGLQGAGKTSFYQQRFAGTHMRISLDALKTRAREWAALQACLAERKNFVVDNTNPTAQERARYIAPAKAAGYAVVAYYFNCPIEDCLQRNRLRAGKARVPPPALFGTRKRLQPPSRAEGFDAVYAVTLDADGSYAVSALAAPG